MKKIDIKSLVVGMVVGVCMLLGLGAATGNRADIGRYQIECTDGIERCFVIDTTTGQVWLRHCSKAGYNYGSLEEWNKK